MRVTPIIIGAPGMVTKGLVRRLEELKIGGHAVTVQTTALLIRVLWRLVVTQTPMKNAKSSRGIIINNNNNNNNNQKEK